MDVQAGRRHIERFRAPAGLRAELTDLITRAGGLVWSRPGLAPAQRSLTTIAVLVATGKLGPLREHIEIGLVNGLSQTEISEAILQCAVYAGFPAMVAAMEVAADVFDGERSDAPHGTSGRGAAARPSRRPSARRSRS
jgi:alkylhydroperoxidase/carboxymuconolactone decarboxylase family protein YurZ